MRTMTFIWVNLDATCPKLYLFHGGGLYYIKTISWFLWSLSYKNYGFYMIGTSVIKELNLPANIQSVDVSGTYLNTAQN